MGVIYLRTGEYDIALDNLERAKTIFKKIDDRECEGTTLNNLSQIYHAQGDYNTALAYLEQSLVIRRDIGDRAGEGTTLNNLSQIYHDKGDYNTALGYLEQSLDIWWDIWDRAGLCATLINLGRICWEIEQPEKAMPFWLEVYRIAAEIGFKEALDNLEKAGNQLGGNGLDYWKEQLAKVGRKSEAPSDK